MQALSRTFNLTHTFNVSRPRPARCKLISTRTSPVKRNVISCSGLQTLAPLPGRTGTMVSAKQDEEERQDTTCSKLTLAGHKLEGLSIAGQETCIILPSANLVFDSGRCPQRSVPRGKLFLTHEHLDHMGGIPAHICSRQMLGLPPTWLYIPDFLEAPIAELLTAYRAFSRCEMPCNITPMQIGQEYQVGGYLVKPFKTYHTVPSQGYLLIAERNKLKEEYLGLPGKEIAAAKQRGEEITHHVVVPELAFTGDTTAEFFTDPANEEVFKARLLIMECTFLDDAMTPENAKARGHMHLDDIVEHADKFQNEAVLLIHFSSRYSRSRIQELLAAKLPAGLAERCTPMLEGFR